VLLVGIASAVPLPDPSPASKPAVAISTMASPVRAELDAAVAFLPEPEQLALQKQLDEISQGQQSTMHEKWEAVESAKNRLDEAMAKSAAAIDSLTESLDEMAVAVSPQANPSADSPTSSAENIQSSLTREQIQQLTQQLEAAAKNPNLALSKDQQDALRKLASEAKMGSPSPDDLGKLRRKLKDRADALEHAREKTGGSGTPGKGGKGGVDRGRGDAPIDYGRNDAVHNPGVKQEKLENQFLDTNHMISLGITPIKPKTNPGIFSPAIARTLGQGQGSVVSRNEISPSQQQVVKEYFQELPK
jgi:hypothetical protein